MDRRHPNPRLPFCAASPLTHAHTLHWPVQGSDLPLMLRALRGDAVERPPVWMMRQAGRYMKVYQELCKTHTTFRQRSGAAAAAWRGGGAGGADGGGVHAGLTAADLSLKDAAIARLLPICFRPPGVCVCAENVDVAVEVSLQPWRAFQPDGVILFSDILTPITGMNIPFDITAGERGLGGLGAVHGCRMWVCGMEVDSTLACSACHACARFLALQAYASSAKYKTPLHASTVCHDAGKGPVIANPIRTMAEVDAVTPLVPDDCVPFVGEALRRLRAEVRVQGPV